MTELLIGAGADVKAVGAYGVTCLHIVCRPVTVRAADPESLVVARTLIEAGADVNARDIDGRTPLGLLTYWARPKHIIGSPHYPLGLAKLLIDSGADVDAKDNEGRTPRGSVEGLDGEGPPQLLDYAAKKRGGD